MQQRAVYCILVVVAVGVVMVLVLVSVVAVDHRVTSMIVSSVLRVCTISRGDCGWVRRRTKIITDRTIYVTLP